MGPQIGPSQRDKDAGTARRYLEIINHIVTRRTDEEREATGEGEKEPRTTVSMDLSDTLINSKLLITDPALRAAIALLLHQTHSHTLQKATIALSAAYNAVSTRSESHFHPDDH